MSSVNLSGGYIKPEDFLAKYGLRQVERWNDLDSWRWYRYIDDPDQSNYFASVTNILGVAQHEKLQSYKENVSQVRQDVKLSEAAGLGTYIHELIGKDLMGLPITQAELRYEYTPLQGVYERWLALKEKHDIKALTLELPVYSTTLGYGGTLDFLGWFDGRLVVADFKSGRYSIKTGWQMAAYMMALREMAGIEAGMVGVSIPWNRVATTLQYTHLDFCSGCFVATGIDWVGMYFNKLAKFNWKYLDVWKALTSKVAGIVNQKP